ncbi:MAG: OmpA family protein [Silicimonas sp.]|nr:OmpA family protein [Silicimonas sp.]
MPNEVAPIIIKRKKVVAGGHHGGAWKVAYADFVTAMMAFFLLMWLLGATTEKQRKGIADYFNPSIPVNKVSGGGAGAFGGSSIFTEDSLSENGTGAGLPVEFTASEADGRRSKNEREEERTGPADNNELTLEEIAELLEGKAGESMVSDLLSRHIVTRLTDEGLIVEIFDLPGEALFSGEDDATETLRAITSAVAEVFRLAGNDIAVQGHTAAVPLAARLNPVWELSQRRADATRRLLVEDQIDPERMQRITGFADRKPVTADPLSERNNRIEVILLRSKV